MIAAAKTVFGIRGLRGQRRLRVEVAKQLGAWLERRRVAPVSVRVAFFDDDGPRGGVAIRCALTLSSQRGPLVRVEHTARTYSAAFRGAFAILKRRLKRRVERGRRRARRPAPRTPGGRRTRRQPRPGPGGGDASHTDAASPRGARPHADLEVGSRMPDTDAMQVEESSSPARHRNRHGENPFRPRDRRQTPFTGTDRATSDEAPLRAAE